MKILLHPSNLRDVPLVRETLASAARGRSDVIAADGVPAALKQLESSRPDVVLLGATLAGSATLETLTRMRALAPDIPVVVLADTSDESFFTRAMAMGAQECLVIGENDAISLIRILRHAVERKRC